MQTLPSRDRVELTGELRDLERMLQMQDDVSLAKLADGAPRRALLPAWGAQASKCVVFVADIGLLSDEDLYATARRLERLAFRLSIVEGAWRRRRGPDCGSDNPMHTKRL